MSLRGLEGEDLQRNLQHLIQSFDTQISELDSTSQVKDYLIQLERNDENFHKHEFVKQLKSRIDDVLRPCIDEEIERNSTAGHVALSGFDVERLVKQRTEAILNSRQYKEFKNELHGNIKEAVDYLISNYDSTTHTDDPRSGYTQRHGFLGSDDEDLSSCGSTFGQGSVMMFDPDTLKKIADDLSKTKSHQQKREALVKLNHIMSSEIVNNQHWPYLRKHLLTILSDPDEELTQLSQKFIAKAFSSTCHQTKEIYTLLCEHLISQFQNKDTSHLLSEGMDITKPDTRKLLRAFRLMNEFQQEAPNYWIRYPDRYLEEVVESTCKLLSINPTTPSNNSYITPLHYIALVDPKATWCTKWMHGNYSRRALLHALTKYRKLIEGGVYHCVRFFATCKNNKESKTTDITETLSRISIGTDIRRLYYTPTELQYVYFIHSLSFVGRLLCFIQGRKFLPIKYKDIPEPVTVTSLLMSLVMIIVECPPVRGSKSESLDAASLVCEVLKDICSCGRLCEICFCRNEITNTLLKPISQYLSASSNKKLPSEEALLRVADILCVVASDEFGRQHLMYGENGTMFSKNRSPPPIHYICDFTKKCLRKELPSGTTVPSRTVIGVYLYICRQLYITCDGLYSLHHYNLHSCVAEAWQEASKAGERAITPTPSDSPTNISKTDDDQYNVLFWEQSLLGSLLNFASTARGILLLQQIGIINECVEYMYDRYKRKLQVGKFEKFGYGVMVTQVAATSVGTSALQNTGYVKSLIHEIWTSLECGVSDVPEYTPKCWPVDVIDRGSHKHLIRISNILSSFSAVYELLATKPLPVKDNYSFREMPDTIGGLFDRLIMVDSPAKIHSLFHYEHSHVFGLRILSVMVSCLDTSLLLQSQYKYQDILLQTQNENKTDSDQFIIDMLSTERNYLLVSSYLIGGPTERILPPHTIEQDTQDKEHEPTYQYPLFSSYPVPRHYVPNLAGRSAMKQAFVESADEIKDNEISKFLAAKVERKPAWLEKCRNLYFNLINRKPDQVKGMLLQLLFEQTVQGISLMKDEAMYTLTPFKGDDSSIKNYNLSPLQLLGVKVAVRYGVHLKVVNNASEATESLTHLLKQCGVFFHQKSKYNKSSSALLYEKSGYPGFDWFVSTIFLMFNGNSDKTWKFLHKFTILSSSGYLWMSRLHCSEDLPDSILYCGIPPLFFSTAHNIEFLLQCELPLVASAFKMSGYTPSQICVHWLKQCFWNYLDWCDICHYLLTCIVMGVDYQVYTCIAIFQHLQQNILQHMQTHDLIIFLKEQPIREFKISDNVKYMKTLETKYRNIVLKDMVSILSKKKQ